MATNLSLGITLTLIGASAAAGALGTVGQRVDSIGQAIDKLKTRQKTALGNMDREWVWGGNSVKKYADEVDKLDRKIQTLATRQERIRNLGEQMNKNRQDMSARYGDLMTAYGMSRMLGAPVEAFVRQDDALNSLQVAMMDKNGQVGASYEALKRQAVELGNQLPGTTADFVGTARALMEQGVAVDSVLNGGLKSASYLSVVLRIPAEQAGEMAAKLREAYKLSDDELTKMADSMQRAKFAFGMKPGDLMAASSYQAPTLNQLGITGIGNTNKMLAIQGMAAQVGLEGSSFGTNFSMMLSRLAKGPEMVDGATKGIKGEADDILKSLGIKFDFFDKNRNFAGLDHMVQELEKLKVIKDKMGDEKALIVADALFGAEAGRPALILAQQGMAGYLKAQETMAKQADLQQRIEKTTSSTRNTFEALTGSVENFGAAMAGPAVQWLHPVINALNDATGWMTSFAEAHPTAVKWIGLLVGGLAVAAITFLSVGVAAAGFRLALTSIQLIPLLGPGLTWLATMLRMGLSGAFGVARLAATGLWSVLVGPVASGLRIAALGALNLGRSLMTSLLSGMRAAAAGAVTLGQAMWSTLLSGLRAAGTGALWAGRMFMGGLVGGLRLAGQAALWLGRALLMNPIGLIITGIAVGAYLIYRHWTPIKGFFLGLWGGVKTAFTSAWTGATAFVSGVWSQIQTAFSGGIAGVGKLLINWSPLGLFYKAFSGVMSWFGVTLPKNFTDFGANIINGLTSGIKSAIGGAVSAIGDFAGGLKSKFTSLLGIKSPSTVFMGFGGNIGQGAALGIMQALPGVQGAASKLAGVALAGAVAASAQASAGVKPPMPVLPSVQQPGVVRQAVPQAQAAAVAPRVQPDVGLGGNIGQGVALGIMQALPGVQAAMAARANSERMAEGIRAASQALPRIQGAAPAAPGGQIGGGGMTINFSPNITVGGGANGGDVTGQVQQAMQLSMRELEQMLRRVQAEQQRRSF